jgi:hypothetical protein
MALERNALQFEGRLDGSLTSRQARDGNSTLAELVEVLTAHPAGLRRWSVMRAIRREREQSGREIPQKLEDEVERAFRRFCIDQPDGKTRGCSDDTALFYRPQEKAGEVWALISGRGEAWLSGDAFPPLPGALVRIKEHSAG